MSYADFSSIFPYIKTGAEMSYEPSDKVKGDNRYKTKIELTEGDYYLYYFWDNKSLHQFVDKVGVDLKEFKNY